ncbi:uncharacterized protein CDV56_101720 [Aspergillus thermomutatus]|uniref:Uncharacterized protein n=1 Tax=Aspergillus thermomutatus TaxID=41047 RepID=A0A397G1A8_ASPTH|nr:uncharacterized protein CDV56_101720 [Aspergillus thermomutatus]RHZ43604.1 hypothetical protein CDV56_101720 [Aspergillus thermomutatus]
MTGMAMWSCDFENCGKPSVRIYGQCIICDRHLCAKHLSPKYHSCPSWEDERLYDPIAQEAEQKEITKLLNKINIPALLARASHLRQGVRCSLPQSLQYDHAKRTSVMGGMNYHIEIQFEDGISWLARIRRFNATSPPPDIRGYILRSEVATLQFLSKTKIPSPKVFDYNLEQANPIGVEYILMEKLPGKSLRWSLTTTEQRKKIISQLADIYMELKAFPFDSMGSLDQPGTDHVGPFARESLMDYIDSQMRTLGPFTSRQEYIVSSIQFTLDLIIRGESYADRAIDAFLIHRFPLDAVSVFLHAKPEPDQFYLRHADDKGDHLLVDDDYNITGVVDWEWAHTDSKSAAFNSPVLLLPVADFYDGINHPGEDELAFAQSLENRVHPDLAEIVRNGRILHRFEFCCGYDLADWKGFLCLFQGLRKAIDVDGDLEWETWKEKALETYKNDALLKELMKRDHAGVDKILDELEVGFHQGAIPTPGGLIEIFLRYGRRLKRLFIIVDAINESQEAEYMADALLTLLRSSDNIHLFVTSTTTPAIPSDINAHKVQMTPSTNQDDIRDFLSTQLESRSTLRRLPSHIKHQIAAVLTKNANGMFRYVQCQLDLLSVQRTGRDISKALETIPESLNSTYKFILCRIPPHDRELVRDALLWITYSREELSLPALTDALALQEGDRHLADECRLFDPTIIVSLCQGLIVYDENTSTVSLAHSSVHSFLTSEAIKRGPAAFYSLNEIEATQRIYKKCLTYLTMDAFRQPCADFESLERRFSSFPLLEYAAQNWPLYCGSRAPAGFILPGQEIEAILGFFGTHRLPNGGNYTSWVQVLLLEAPVDASLATEPLYYASSFALLPVVDKLIQNGANLESYGGRNHSTPLIVASYRGHLAVAKRLLKAGADPNAVDASDRSSLDWAKLRGWQGVVDLLLMNGAYNVRLPPPIGVLEAARGCFWRCGVCYCRDNAHLAAGRCSMCGHVGIRYHYD